MRRLMLILFCFPIIGLSQKYDKTISLSQFVQDLKQAAKQGTGYNLENCHITYGNSDKQYLSDNNSRAVINEVLNFDQNSLVRISNCKFGGQVSQKTINERGFNNNLGVYSSVLELRNAHFGDLIFYNVDADIRLDSITAEIGVSFEITNKKPHILEISSSNINGIYLNCHEKIQFSDIDYYLKIDESKINFCIARNIKKFHFNKNQVATLVVDGYCEDILVQKNHFSHNFKNLTALRFKDSQSLIVENFSGINIGKFKRSTSLIGSITIEDNFFDEIPSDLSNDTLLKIIKSFESDKCKYHQLMYMRNAKSKIKLIFYDSKLQLDKNLYNLQWNDKDKLNFLCDFLRDQDTLEIKYESVSRISIRKTINNTLKINNNKLKECFVFNNTISTTLEIQKTFADSLMYFYNNIIPDKHNIAIDKSAITNLGFIYKGGGYFYGNEDYSKVQEKLQEEQFLEHFLALSAQYRQFIAVYHENGSDFKEDAVIALKDFQTNKKMYKYYQNSDVINLLNWRGGQFLGIYCDYGLNPFKALKYCFYVMLFFAFFYFFFYSDWDKIDRAFLIKRFSNVIDYFSSEKRIEDFYTDSHNQEMKTFVDFKSLLNTKKIHTPFFIHAIAKPLYKLSLVRYKALNYWYKKAEFMAGKRWGDLNFNQRYIIGLLTGVLLILYIIYLIFIRALNSFILSLNAFSTLGFGQIPVRGFTKYVTIIEGFVGWFLLGVFIVSLLNQMSNI